MAVELAVLAATLPRLRALELTFFPPGIADAVREVVDLQVVFRTAQPSSQAAMSAIAPVTAGVRLLFFFDGIFTEHWGRPKAKSCWQPRT